MSSISTQAAPTPIQSAPPLTPKPTRLASLDLFRGLTVAGMLLVNNPGPGGVYSPLEHASETPAWHGWTPTDLVFPFFLFIMGVAIPFSFAKRSATDSKLELFLHILARGVSLFLLGDFLYALPRSLPDLPANFGYLTGVRVFVYAFLLLGFVLLLYPWKSRKVSITLPFIFLAAFVIIWNVISVINTRAVTAGLSEKLLGPGLLNPDHLRIPGVLQRIGAVYVAAASLALFCKRRGLIIASVALLTFYTLLMTCVSYPSLAEHGQYVRNLWGEEDNLARYVDLAVFTTKAGGNHVYGSYPDPEGLLSTLPAIVTSLFGIFCGLWLRSDRPLADRCAALLSFGVLGFLAGYALSALGIPINKPLWTPSYVFVCAGLAMLGLGTFFYLSDILMVRKPFFLLKWYGMNAIAAFVLAGLVARVNGMVRWHDGDKLVSLGQLWSTTLASWGQHLTLVGDPKHNGSLAYALSFVLVIGLFMAVMYRLKIFLKV